MTINNSNKVGIGNPSVIEGVLTINGTAAELPTSGTTSNSLLQLVGTGNVQLNMGCNTVTGNYGSYIQASDNNLAVPYQLNLQPNGGNVCITATATKNPDGYDSNRTFLTVQAKTGGSDRGAFMTLVGTAGGSPNYWIGRYAFASTTATYNHASIISFTDTGGAYSGNLIFTTNANASTGDATERMRITSGGLVGMGTTTPVGKLAVLTNGTWFTPTNTGAIGGASSQRVNLVGSEPGIMLSSDNSTGTQTSQIGLQIGIYSASDIRSQLYWGGNPLVFMYSGDNGATATNRFSISTAGNVGLTRSATTNTLEVNGDASKSTAGSWLANSDINIKTDINTIDGALDRINKVRLVSFKYKDAYKEANNGIKDKYYHNVIAQEFQDIYPDYVYDSGDVFEEHKVLQVDTNPMYVDSVSAIQELSKMVIDLQNQINELKNK